MSAYNDRPRDIDQVGSQKSARSRNLEAATRAFSALIDSYAKTPRSRLHAAAAVAVMQRLAAMTEEQRAAYEAAPEPKKDAWAARAFREEMARLQKEHE